MRRILRRKFVLVAMAAISILLVVLVGATNLVNIWHVNQQSEHLIQMLADRHTRPGPQQEQREEPQPQDFFPFVNEDQALSARYFLVWSREGEIIRTDVSEISTISEEEARLYGEQVFSEEKEKGRCDQFLFLVEENQGEMGQIIVFLDQSLQLQSMISVLLISCGMAIICWILMFFLVMLLSKRGIEPIAQSIEKQKQFVTDAGHELKTPLAIIQANIDALELHQGTSRWSKNIHDQVQRLNRLMGELLELARLEEQGKKEVKTSAISL